MGETEEQGAPRTPLNPHAANFTAPEPPLGSLGTRFPRYRLRFPQPSDYDDSSSYSPRWSPEPIQYNDGSSHAPQAFSQSDSYNEHLRNAPQMPPQSNEYNDGSSYAPQAFSQSDSYNEHLQNAPQMPPQSNEYNDGSSYAPQAIAQSSWLHEHPQYAPQAIAQSSWYHEHPQYAPHMASQSNEDNRGSSYTPQVFPQLNSYSEHAQHAPQMSSQSNQYHGHLPYAPSTREAESAWQRPQLPAFMPFLATYGHPTLPSNPFNSSYMHAEHTASASSNVLARMMGPETPNVYDSDHSLGLFDIQDHDRQRATMTGTMTGHDNGHATHLQQHMQGNPQSVPHSERRVMCHECGVSVREKDLELHQKIHPELRCRGCYKICYSSHDLNEHKCTRGMRFKCDLCLRRFGSDLNLALHLESVHGVPISMCGSCGWKFSTRELLKVRFPPVDPGYA